MISASIKEEVRFVETDAMGIVYHANYLPWCECARLRLIESFGVKYTDIVSQGFHLPVISVRVDYKYPARFGDTVEIRAAITQPPTVKIKIDYQITANGRLLAEASTEHVFVDMNGRPVKPPSDFMAALRAAMQK